MRLLSLRLDRQLISHPRFPAPAEVVAWFGAMQAQDYLAALWAVGLRTPKATGPAIESAIADGSVIRTHVFRGTWQYVAREDVRWMLGLVGARVIASGAARYRQLELDGPTLERCCKLFARALEGGRQLTRTEMRDVLEHGGIVAVGIRLLHILGHAEVAGVICSGARRGKQSTYALLDDRVPKSRAKTRDEALAELVGRYFQSRGPATARDFAWWTGLTLGDAREAIALAGTPLISDVVNGETYWHVGGKITSHRSPSAYLLPAFDEYLVGYQDRNALIDPAHVRKVNAGGGILSPVVVLDGRVVGMWKRTLGRDSVSIAVRTFARLGRGERDAIAKAAERYARFLGIEERVAIGRG